ncbi:MAG: hypothetical protein ACTSRU_20650, partial [Candidatus Hodarchaeales archaeon]
MKQELKRIRAQNKALIEEGGVSSSGELTCMTQINQVIDALLSEVRVEPEQIKNNLESFMKWILKEGAQVADDVCSVGRIEMAREVVKEIEGVPELSKHLAEVRIEMR